MLLKPVSYLPLLACWLLSYLTNLPGAKAQGGIWDNTRHEVKDNFNKKKSGLQRWKDHIQNWGVDSSYNHSFSIGGRLNTNGWCGFMVYQRPLKQVRYRGRNKNAGKSELWQLSFSEIKHEKQIKQQGKNTAFPELGAATSYIFGKINNLYLLQLGYGRQRLLLPGVLEGNISVSFRYGAGFSLAMLKPYYLRLINVEYVPEEKVWQTEEAYSEANAAIFLDKDRILGSSGFSKGLDKIRYVPGAYLESAFVIEPSKNKTFIQTITLGGQLSIYSQKLPIMAERKAFPYQGALFIGFQFGKRW